MSYVSENFKVLSEICECIARQFGEDCEVVLHDLTKSYDNTIVAIWNGHVTGRKVGDGGTDAGLAILRGTTQPKDEYCYINKAPNGHVLRSTSKYFLDDENKEVRLAACKAAISIGTEYMKTRVRHQLSMEKDPEVKKQIQDAFNQKAS